MAPIDNGLLVGKSHAQGGIKLHVKPDNYIVEAEGNEFIICNAALQSGEIFEFKDKTNLEILQEIYKKSLCHHTGNTVKDREFVICKLAVNDKTRRNLTGTIQEIINVLQSEKSCNILTDKHQYFNQGGLITDIYSDHFKAYLWCNGMLGKVDDMLNDAISREVATFYLNVLMPHFLEEEKVLFPKYKINYPNQIKKLIAQHRQMESIILEIHTNRHNKEKVKQLCTLLKEHIRLEDKLTGSNSDNNPYFYDSGGLLPEKDYSGIRNKITLFSSLLKKLPGYERGQNIPANETGFISRLILDTKNGVQYNKTKLENIASQFGISSKNLAKELAELSIVIMAREIAHEKGKSDEQKFRDIVSLYEKQVNLSHRTSESIMLQQYSTPAPIGYLMGLYVGIDKPGFYFEPSAGNGLLTIAGHPDNFIVNEIDAIRNRNLMAQGFTEVLHQDASGPFRKFEKHFDGILTNPPFGKIDVTVDYGDFEINSLEQVMALRALDTMKDSGRGAIIIGGHTTWDEEGRIQKGKNRIFFSFLFKNYFVDDIINIDGHALYSRQGTAFNVRMILIRGRKPIPEGYALLKQDNLTVTDPHSPEAITDFDDLFVRVKNSLLL